MQGEEIMVNAQPIKQIVGFFCYRCENIFIQEYPTELFDEVKSRAESCCKGQK